MRFPWTPKDATVCYELSGCSADKKLGIAVRGSIPLKFLPTPHDVSVKDIFMSGTIEEIIAKLDIIETLKPRYFYVTNRYSSIKIWINQRSESLNSAVVDPFADAVINNSLGLAMAWSQSQFGSTVTPELQGIISNSMSELGKSASGIVAAQVLGQGSNAISSKTKSSSPNASAGSVNFSTVKSLTSNTYAFGKNIANSKAETKNYDISFSNIKPETPIFRDKTKRKNKVKALLHKTKQMIAPENLIIRVGSEFNKHHAGTVIDLGVRAISAHDLIDFLTYYAEEKKIINCFHDSSNENVVTAKVNVI